MGSNTQRDKESLEQKKCSENEILERLFNEHVKLDKQISGLHQKVLNTILEVLIHEAREVSPDFIWN